MSDLQGRFLRTCFLVKVKPYECAGMPGFWHSWMHAEQAYIPTSQRVDINFNFWQTASMILWSGRERLDRERWPWEALKIVNDIYTPCIVVQLEQIFGEYDASCHRSVSGGVTWKNKACTYCGTVIIYDICGWVLDIVRRHMSYLESRYIYGTRCKIDRKGHHLDSSRFWSFGNDQYHEAHLLGRANWVYDTCYEISI